MRIFFRHTDGIKKKKKKREKKKKKKKASLDIKSGLTLPSPSPVEKKTVFLRCRMWLLFIRARLTAPDSTRFNEGNWEVLPPPKRGIPRYFFPSSPLHSIRGWDGTGRKRDYYYYSHRERQIIVLDYSLTFRIFFSTVENMSA